MVQGFGLGFNLNLTQAEEKMSHDSRHMTQLQQEERRLKEEVELMKGQMKAVVAKSVALERQMATANGNVLTTEQQLRQALVAGAPNVIMCTAMLALHPQPHSNARLVTLCPSVTCH